MKIGFNVKYGRNEIEMPVTAEAKTKFRSGIKNKFTNKVTIYNDVVLDGGDLRRFDRFVIDKCLIYDDVAESTDGTVQKIVNSRNVITKDVERYKPPVDYKALAEDEKERFYTVQIDDFVVLGEVDDVVTTEDEFLMLQKKYKNIGFLVTAIEANIYGLDVDNVKISH